MWTLATNQPDADRKDRSVMKNQSGDNFEKKASARPKLSLRKLQSDWIFEGEQEVIIVHHEQEYRLRVTRADKLILTK